MKNNPEKLIKDLDKYAMKVGECINELRKLFDDMEKEVKFPDNLLECTDTQLKKILKIGELQEPILDAQVTWVNFINKYHEEWRSMYVKAGAFKSRKHFLEKLLMSRKDKDGK